MEKRSRRLTGSLSSARPSSDGTPSPSRVTSRHTASGPWSASSRAWTTTQPCSLVPRLATGMFVTLSSL